MPCFNMADIVAIQLSPPVVLTAMPIFFFEMVFAAWLFVKGFNSSAGAPESAITEAYALLAQHRYVLMGGL
jgi:hypothetical protein